MSESLKQGPPDEQTVCVTCGFCCDGTLFLHATLSPGERGHLPEKIEANSYSAEGKDYFRLPCQYFSGKCTIYDRERAFVCSSYRCQLLRDLKEGKMTLPEALEVVRDASGMRQEIMEEHRRVTGKVGVLNFKLLLAELAKRQKACPDTDPAKMEYDLLLARCNIFEALLIRHFRSTADFEKMMAGEDDKRQR